MLGVLILAALAILAVRFMYGLGTVTNLNNGYPWGIWVVADVVIGSAFAYAVLAVVWAIALGGAVAKLFFWKSPGRLGPTLYLLMGWLSIALVWSLAMTLPVASTALVVIGGLLYSAGVIFFVWEGLRFSNAIWHGFVLAASACFFAAIAMGVLG